MFGQLLRWLELSLRKWRANAATMTQGDSLSVQ